MASTVHYKFKSQKDYDSIEFDGMFISVGDLKRQIDKRGLGRDQAMELQLTNAQTNEDYEDDAVGVEKHVGDQQRVPRDQLAAVGSEVGSTTVKKTVRAAAPDPGRDGFRKPPPRRNMTYIAPERPVRMAPPRTRAPIRQSPRSSAARRPRGRPRAAASAMGRGGAGEAAEAPPAAGGAWRPRTRHGHQRTAPGRLCLLQVLRTRPLDPPVPDERRSEPGRRAHEDRARHPPEPSGAHGRRRARRADR